jgi:hypothetical protein
VRSGRQAVFIEQSAETIAAVDMSGGVERSHEWCATRSESRLAGIERTALVAVGCIWLHWLASLPASVWRVVLAAERVVACRITTRRFESFPQPADSLSARRSSRRKCLMVLVVSLTFASWNLICNCLQRIDAIRSAA